MSHATSPSSPTSNNVPPQWEGGFTKHSLVGCALRLLDYTTHVNPKARMSYNAIASTRIQKILKAHKIPSYDPPSNHTQTTVDQEINFMLLVASSLGADLRMQVDMCFASSSPTPSNCN